MIILFLLELLVLSIGMAQSQQQAPRRTAWLHGSATVGPHIQTGVVPIFDKRNTMEPITFTFTTPLPRVAHPAVPVVPSYWPTAAAAAPPSPWSAAVATPSLRPSDQFEVPYARPAPPRMSAYKPSFQASFAQQPPPVFTENYQIPSSITARSAFLPPSNRFVPSSPSLSSPAFPDLFGNEIDGVRHNALQSWTQVITPLFQTTVTLPSDDDNTTTVTSPTPRVFRITLPSPKKNGRRVVTTTPVSVLGVLREPRTITIHLPSPDDPIPSGNNSTTVDDEPMSIDPELVKKSLWDAVDFLKGAVAEAGVDRDWRALWTKMSGVVEPYVERMTEHLGSAINIALKQQNNRRMRTTPSPYFYYNNNQQQRVNRF